MLRNIRLKLSKIKYGGNSVGRDVRVEIKVLDKFLQVDKRIKAGTTVEVNREIGEFRTEDGLFRAEVFITVIEKDLLFNDIGTLKSRIEIDTVLTKPQTYVFQVEVQENRSLLRKLFWGSRKAVFEIAVEAEAVESTSAKIALHADIDSKINSANLRKEANDKSNIVKEIPNHASVVIIKEAVMGSRPRGYLSDLWHEVLYQGDKGFIHSALVEISGQERNKIVEAIKTKAREFEIDEKLALNLGHCESKWLPFAHSETDNKGIYQLGADAIQDINKKYGGRILDAHDPYQNIDGGLRYLRFLLKRYAGLTDYLTRVIVAWSVGYPNVPTDGSFSLKNYTDSQTHQLIGCTLKEKRGEKILLYLKFLIVFIFIGWASSFLTFPADNISFCSLVDAAEGEIVIYDRNCKKIYSLTADSFLAGQSEFWLSDSEKANLNLYLGDSILRDKKDSLYFLVTASGFCGSGGCSYTLYEYDVNAKLITLASNIRGATDMLLSPDEKALAVTSIFYGGACHPGSTARIINLLTGDNKVIKFNDPELVSDYIEKMEWLSAEEVKFTTVHTGGCDPSVSIFREKEFIYNIEDGIIKSRLIKEENILRDGAG